MKIFLLKCTLFVGLLIFVTLSLHFVAKKNHKFLPSKLYYADDFKKAYNNEKFDVLVLGNSKVLSAIDKVVLERNLNQSVVQLGYSSSNVSVSKLILESFIRKNNKPKLILFEVSWFTFNTKRTDFHDFVGDLFIKDEYLWCNYKDYNEDQLLFKVKKAYKKSLSNLIKRTKTTYHQSYDDTFKASDPLKKSYVFDKNKFLEIFPKQLANVDKVLLRDFNEIKRICETNGIKLILFTSPEDETYSKNQKDNNKVKNIFKQSAKQSSAIHYLDYTFGGCLFDKKMEYWLKDSHHINEKNLFTEKLSNDIKKRLIK